MNFLTFIILIFWGIILPQPIKADTDSPSDLFDNYCVTRDEMRLYALINNYRREKNLPEIPLSRSLSYVARQHTIDLAENLKELTHAWSTCDYNHKNKDSYYCMWLKPSELTNYKAFGYECLYVNFGMKITPDEALNAWKKSPNHNNVIINKSIWAKIKWQALGVGIYNGYAAIWFGEELDSEIPPIICE